MRLTSAMRDFTNSDISVRILFSLAAFVLELCWKGTVLRMGVGTGSFRNLFLVFS